MKGVFAAFVRNMLCPAAGIISLIAPLNAEPEDSMQKVRSRAVALLLGGGGDGERQRLQIQANHIWCVEQLNQSFNPVAWKDDSGSEVGIRFSDQAENLSRMAVVYCSDTEGLNKSPELRRRIEECLANILDHYNPKTPRPGNWVYWQIRLPHHLGMTALLMESDIAPELLARTLESLRFQLQGMNLEGVNAAWEARNQMFLALLDRDRTRMQRAANHVFKSVRYGRNGGVREDFCYTFHGVIPYAGGYGASFVQTLSQFIYLLEGTPWAAATWCKDLLSDTLLEHSRWFVYGGGMNMQVMGRTYAWGKSASSFALVTEAFLLLSQVDSKRRNELEATAVALLGMKTEAAPRLGGFADRLPKVPGALPTGFRYWPSGEVGAFNGGTYHVGFRQFSQRVQDYEFLNRQGAEGWNLSYGFTFMMRSDGTGSWFSKVEPESEAESRKPLEMDMQYLPGSTSRLDGNPVNEIKEFDYAGYGLNFGTSPFAGGAGGEKGGVAGFILVPPYSGFIARKSLHFFRDGFWALGSGIESKGDHPWKDRQRVITTVLQWPCGMSKPELFTDGAPMVLKNETTVKKVRWLWLERVAVVFAEPTKISIRRRGSVITAWIDHGVKPKSATYAYATLPDVALEEASDFAKHLPVRPLNLDSNLHAVRGESSGHESFIFFKPGSCLDVEAKQPLVLYRESGKEGGLLSLQDPLHQEGELAMSAVFSGKINPMDQEIKAASGPGGRVQIVVATLSGRIYRIGHGAAGKEVAATRRMDLSALRQFQVKTESDPTQTILTVQLPSGLKESEFTFSIHGDRGHHQATLTEKDVLDRPSSGVIRYVWRRRDTPQQEREPGPSVRARQTVGDFRVFLRTTMTESVEFFSVPVFKSDGSADTAAELRRDYDNPTRPRLAWPNR